MGVPISKPLFGLNWLLTNAQVELMAIDVSVVNYKSGKKKNNKDNSQNFNTPSIKSLSDAASKWREKYSNKEDTRVALSDIF